MLSSTLMVERLPGISVGVGPDSVSVTLIQPVMTCLIAEGAQ